MAVHAIVLLLLGAVSANVATLIFARTAMRESEIVVRHGTSRPSRSQPTEALRQS